MKKPLKLHQNKKFIPKKKTQKFMFLVGSVGFHTILHDPTVFTILVRS